MESVIDKLSEIETAASRIMESAVEETRRQDNAAEERTSTSVSYTHLTLPTN